MLSLVTIFWYHFPLKQERHISRRHDLQKISAFNLGVSEAVNAKKKAKDTEPQVGSMTSGLQCYCVPVLMNKTRYVITLTFTIYLHVP